MTIECLVRAIERVRETHAHVYVVVPDDRWQAVMTEASALLYGRAETSGRTWLFPNSPEHKGGVLTVVPVSENVPGHAFTLAPCAWGLTDAQPLHKWRSRATGEVSCA